MSHTPGPWGFTYDGSGDYSIGPEDDPQVGSIATVREREFGHRDWQRATANARLISKAPDMLAALKDTIRAHCPTERFFCSTCTPARKLIASIEEPS